MPTLVAAGALAYLVAYGARTPLLALRGLLRVANLAVIIVPAVAVGTVALIADGRVDPRTAAGAIALAIVAAPFVAPELVGRMRARSDQAGALVLGTVLVSLLIVGSRGAVAAGGLFMATEAFAISAMVANGLPTLRDALLTPLRILGWIAPIVVLGAAVISAPPIDAQTVAVAAALFVAGAGTSALVALRLGRDVAAAVGGAGLRDPALGVALASITAGPDSAGVPLVYGVFCLGLAALSFRPR